jgi:hypothetical protein
MGQEAEAEVTEEIETGEAETENLDELETEEEAVEGEEGEKVEAEEFDVVRDVGESQPPQAKQTGFQKRVNKLNAKIDTANQEKDKASNDADILREKNKLLEIALEQAKGNQANPLIAPNPDEYHAGEFDAEFIKKKEAYTDARIAKQVADQVAEATKLTVQTQQNAVVNNVLQGKQEEHYARAEKLGVKEYDKVEDKAIEIMGLENVNHIVGNFSDSEKILFYLGKNPKEAEALNDLIKKNAIQGVAALGELRASIKVKPKSKTNAPNPDDELEGGSSPTTGTRGPKGAKFT